MEEVSLILRNEWAGYRRLCAAMIARGLGDLGLCIYHVVPAQRSNQEHVCAYDWIYGPPDPEGLTFEHCCEVLEIDAGWLRRAVKPLIVPVAKHLRQDRKDARLYEVDGERRSLRNWAKIYNICYDTLIARLRSGRKIKDALTQPVLKTGPRRWAA